MKHIMMHDINLEPSVIDAFNRIAQDRDRFTDVFTVSKERIKKLQ